MSFIYFLILIGVLIFVHEFGHFVVAKFFDVKVLRFSIGFGPALVKFQGKETEYVICILPLGGYVQMQGSDLEQTEALEEDEQKRSLMAKPIWQRSLIVLAGPAANFILPVIIYFAFGLLQTTTPPALIGQIHADTPAAEAGLKAGDEIVAINGRSIEYWYQLQRSIDSRPGQTLELTYRRHGEEHTIDIVPEQYSRTDFLGLARHTGGRIGIGLNSYGPIVAIHDRDGPAARDGLHFFDRVVTIDGEPVERFDEIKAAVRMSEGQPLDMVVLRPSQLSIRYGGIFFQEPHTVTITPEEVDGEYTLGIEPAQMYLASVDPDGPAAQSGFQSGDKIVGMNGREFGSWGLFTERIQNSVNEMIIERDEAGEDYDIEPTFEVTVQRGLERIVLDYQPQIITFEDDTNQTHYRVEHGWEVFRDYAYPDHVHHSFFSRFGHSARTGVGQTWDFTKMMVVGLYRLAQGRISTESIGGPIMIGELAAEAGEAGIEPFLQMMALISINLAIINLLPIPVLDGGRLVLFGLEAAKRGPLSYRTRQIAAYIGIVLVILLMVFAFKNDIERNWYRVVEWFGD